MLFILIVLMAFFAGIPLCVTKCLDAKHDAKRVRALIAIMVVLTVLFSGAICAMLTTNTNTIKDAHSVATVPIDKNSSSTDAKLYYDNDADEYFTITIDWWNPFNPTRRHKICKTDADTYMQQSNYL